MFQFFWLQNCFIACMSGASESSSSPWPLPSATLTRPRPRSQTIHCSQLLLVASCFHATCSPKANQFWESMAWCNEKPGGKSTERVWEHRSRDANYVGTTVIIILCMCRLGSPLPYTSISICNFEASDHLWFSSFDSIPFFSLKFCYSTSNVT